MVMTKYEIRFSMNMMQRMTQTIFFELIDLNDEKDKVKG